ncbi:type II secretion system protein GspD [Buttiauxella warmboldiae]|uniref:Type II secretion system protein GspD n=1 Tax=Buttiauxella warmboldiae TaxID=82993 RepID=A0A3N5E3M2_9ENTR|nr:type II secretion system secretin GspD [Buttiauxella warmboldiae]RPH29619.1 type II secretion system protein GspD [Buttiauxella warmboldiae]
MSAIAEKFHANFYDTDIREFIDIVSKNLNVTFIVSPDVQGLISVRSYNALDDQQYYQFFLSVLDIYGYSVIPMDNGMFKVVRSANAKSSGAPVTTSHLQAQGDEIITRILSLQNVPVLELAPLLSQLNDNSGVGTISPYAPSNTLLMTGRASVINRLADLVIRVDSDGQQNQDVIPLRNASADDLANVLKSLYQPGGQQAAQLPAASARITADTRTNSIIVSGPLNARQRIRQLVARLDGDAVDSDNTQVIALNYAKAENLVNVLNGVSQKLTKKESSTRGAAPMSSAPQQIASGGMLPGTANGDFNLVADEQTNSLILTASPAIRKSIENVIRKLDVARSQVLVEAIIVEVQDGDGLNLGIQWANRKVGGQQFTKTGLPVFSSASDFDRLEKTGSIASNTALSAFNGVTMGFFRGDWGVLLSALSSNAKNDILSTPSIVTLDNKEASMNVGQDVPVLSGSQTTAADNVFNTVSRKTVGTKLKVTPQINEAGTVQLEIEQEVSSVDASSTGSSLGPTFNTRTIQNAVMVRSGETVVLGGLIHNTSSESESRVPLLGDIPYIGNLFRYRSVENTRRNLMVFIRPTILQEGNIYRDMSLKRYQETNSDLGKRVKENRYELIKPKNLTLPQLNSTSPADSSSGKSPFRDSR